MNYEKIYGKTEYEIEKKAYRIIGEKIHTRDRGRERKNG
jgi:hypothetical protein